MILNEMSHTEHDILNKIETLKTEKDKNLKNNVINLIETRLFPNLLEKRMSLDLSDVPVNKRNELLSDIKEFVSLGREKGYFNDDNILDVLKQLTSGLEGFRTLPSGGVYGKWSGYRGFGIMEIDLNLDKNFMKHVVFHELAHCVTPDLGEISASMEKVYRPTNRNGFNGKSSWIRKDGYEFGWNELEIAFLRECMAENMACELDGMYKPQRTEVASNGANITSDWHVTYNRTYQQLGDEFLQTLPFINTPENDTDRKRFKALTMMALKENNLIAKNIDEVYVRKNPRTGSKDLESITTRLSNLLNRCSLTKEEVEAFRKEIEPYKESPKITVIRRSDQKPFDTEKSDKKVDDLVRRFAMLSPDERVELYSELYGIHEEAKRIFSQFAHMPSDTQKELYEAMQGIAKDREREMQ